MRRAIDGLMMRGEIIGVERRCLWRDEGKHSPIMGCALEGLGDASLQIWKDHLSKPKSK
tara:strand:- start:367 stop:543 length:177 start_codon:yes stop_codon:yes gene_type:complete